MYQCAKSLQVYISLSGEVAEFLGGWRFFWRGGGIFGQVAVFLARWRNFWAGGGFSGKVAEFLGGWRYFLAGVQECAGMSGNEREREGMSRNE